MLESEMRRQTSLTSLSLWSVNELRAAIEYSQCILFRLNRSGKARASAISSLSAVDRNAPFVRWIERQADKAFARIEEREIDQRESPLNVQLGDQAIIGKEGIYPFSHAMLLPLVDLEGRLFGGLLLARQKPWQQKEEVVATRLAGALAHCFHAIRPSRSLRLWSVSRWLAGAAVGLALLALFIPVPMSVLAPAEIIADDPVIVSAPIEGVIKHIYVDPNETVKQGEPLFAFDDTRLKASTEIARRQELVAAAKLSTAKQAAFSDARVYRELAIAKADVDLASAERTFAERNLQRAIVRAGRSGLLIYSDRKDWIGRPVRTGERVMEIATVSQVSIRIDLPVGDAISLEKGARVHLYLDANPLSAITARIRHASYLAEERPGVGLVYKVIADIEDNKGAVVPRIGLRGTAKIFGRKVFLGFYLFRKPISTLRQYFGI